ncbi:unnamed protein product [Protopolystoma xenopodis]|uniref:Uncharacterized protein n=1 Tax=Protopolystoma xenopodis TaxID=117903 RepID=A0A448XBB1_9PLAT|nr:unnamed protein product [Protopolystoma xenopodis]
MHSVPIASCQVNEMIADIQPDAFEVINLTHVEGSILLQVFLGMEGRFSLAPATALSVGQIAQTVAPKIKAKMMEAGTTMVSYQPLELLPNFFRMIVSNPASVCEDVKFLLDEIEKYGEELFPLEEAVTEAEQTTSYNVAPADE